MKTGKFNGYMYSIQDFRFFFDDIRLNAALVSATTIAPVISVDRFLLLRLNSSRRTKSRLMPHQLISAPLKMQNPSREIKSERVVDSLQVTPIVLAEFRAE